MTSELSLAASEGPIDKENDANESQDTAAEEVSPDRMTEVREIIAKTKPTTELEIALTEVIHDKDAYIELLRGEITKLQEFCQRRKQGYKRKRKDGEAPIRPMSGYNLFMKDRFRKIAEENESLLKNGDTKAKLKKIPPSEIISGAGQAWADLPAEEKSKYEARAAEDRKRYEEEMADYNPNEKIGSRRSKTAYNMFFTAFVAEQKNNSTIPRERGSIARIVGEAWKQLPEERKAYYTRLADKYNTENPVPTQNDEDSDTDDIVRDHGDAFHPSDIPGMAVGVPMDPRMAHDPRIFNHPPPPPFYQLYGAPPNPQLYGHHDYSQHPSRIGQYFNGYPR